MAALLATAMPNKSRLRIDVTLQLRVYHRARWAAMKARGAWVAGHFEIFAVRPPAAGLGASVVWAWHGQVGQSACAFAVV